ncbi:MULTISPECIES: carboxylating nicotinate-nucleotide diphosphorylase [unclassified Thioalkalivibrio]|uniref:carboxylating nicotinate-nucleotide diphosphorylase n=1 Tax=unclassified Thioalkalivibrio TaxID=2621013 RepID=UPI000367AA29|nr:MULTISPECIES: carboxylating nicotinate-nucleotide diphosphorylase [unclassified Thioalkalivibrio]
MTAEHEHQHAPHDPFAQGPARPDAAMLVREVEMALAEDLGPNTLTGDITAALVPEERVARATLLLKEPGVLCGQAWFDRVFASLAPEIRIDWLVAEGTALEPDGAQPVATLEGPARAVLAAERAALNLLQTLSGTATETARWVARLGDAHSRILDTRKTLPGLRHGQKYAVRIGGGYNHRLGLWDAVLIKENHIAACGSIAAAVERARALGAGRWVEVETENLDEVEQALAAGADVIMLDELSRDDLATAVQRIRGRAISEASGGVTPDSLSEIAATGVDYISVGALTKHVRAIDFSLRLDS